LGTQRVSDQVASQNLLLRNEEHASKKLQGLTSATLNVGRWAAISPQD
jgi:hypothetical protein